MSYFPITPTLIFNIYLVDKSLSFPSTSVHNDVIYMHYIINKTYYKHILQNRVLQILESIDKLDTN